MANDPRVNERPPLRIEQRSMVDARIIEGAMAVFAEKGLEGTVDDIAMAAGVSRRTVFRHFESSADVFIAAIKTMFAVYEEEVPKPPTPGQDLASWLSEVAERLHSLNKHMLGRGFWDIHVQRPGLDPKFAETLSERNARRAQIADQVAAMAWQAARGDGNPPVWVVSAFVIVLSGFGTNAMVSYGETDPATVSAQILSAVLADAAAGRAREDPAG